MNTPPGIGTMSKSTSVPEMNCLYGCMAFSDLASSDASGESHAARGDAREQAEGRGQREEIRRRLGGTGSLLPVSASSEDTAGEPPVPPERAGFLSFLPSALCPLPSPLVSSPRPSRFAGPSCHRLRSTYKPIFHAKGRGNRCRPFCCWWGQCCRRGRAWGDCSATSSSKS